MSSKIDPRLQYGSVPSPNLTQSSGRVSSLHHSSASSPQGIPTPASYQGHPASPQQPYYNLPPVSHINRSESSQIDQSPGRASEDYQDHGGSEGDLHDQGVNHDPNGDAKRSRACEACRGLKVRCDQDPNQPDVPCKRCAKAGRQCVITAPTRKRQKKTDSRVAELEKKIDALTATLNAQDRKAANPFPRGLDALNSDAGAEPGTGARPIPFWNRKRRRSEVDGDQSPDASNDAHGDGKDGPSGRPKYASSVHASVDYKIDQIISMVMATRLFDRYVKDMAHHLPSVVFDQGTSAAEVRECRPILFLAILEAASVGMTEIHVQDELSNALKDAFADCIIRYGQKSIELVQALQVSNLWYRAPSRYDQLNFYQLIHMGGIMAIDLGMGKRFNPAKNYRLSVASVDKMKNLRRPMLNSDSIEARRTWLGCYFMCSHTSMTLRRPLVIRWNHYMDECLEVLEKSLEALPSDKLLCQHVRLQHINEEVGAHFMMDDPAASSVNIADSRVQYQVKTFERQLRDWRDQCPPHVMTPTLEFSEHNAGLYIHEVAMHINHNIDDFRAPFTEESLKSASGQSNVLSPGHSSALSECLSSVHAMFRTFLAFDLDLVRGLPIFYFVRVAYGTVILIKLYFAVTAKDSEVGRIISQEDLHVEYYLDNLLDRFRTIAEQDAFRPPNKFLTILTKLREWFSKNKDTVSNPRETPREIQSSLPETSQTDSRGAPTIYGSGANPLHFLSEVATNNPNGNSISTTHASTSRYDGQVSAPQQAQQGWISMGSAPMGPPLDPSVIYPEFKGADFEYLDLTLGMADGDLSNLFLGDPNFNLDSMGVQNELYYPGWGQQT